MYRRFIPLIFVLLMAGCSGKVVPDGTYVIPEVRVIVSSDGCSNDLMPGLDIVGWVGAGTTVRPIPMCVTNEDDAHAMMFILGHEYLHLLRYEAGLSPKWDGHP